MKVINKIIKDIAYIAVWVWAVVSLYLASFAVTCMVTGLIVNIFSVWKHSIPIIIQEKTFIVNIVSSVVLTVIMFIVSVVKAFIKNRKIFNKSK